MKLTCAQMDVLISFYIEKELSEALKKQVEEHLKECATCRAKYEIIKSMLGEMKTYVHKDEEIALTNSQQSSKNSFQYQIFKNNLSAYVDNELSNEDNLKMKKFSINNSNARKDLENTYNIRKLMNNSFKKSKSEARQDFSRNVLKQLEIENEALLCFHPAIKLLIIFTLSVLIFTALVIFSLSA